MVFKLFACCIPVDGARRSLVCDILRGNFHFIPNILFEILTVHKDKSVTYIKMAYDNKFDGYIDSYFSFLEMNELGFWCDNPGQFPDLDMTWKHPSAITNAIIDVDRHSGHDFTNISAQLDSVGCDALQLRIFHETPTMELKSIIESFSNGRLKSIDIVIRYSPETSFKKLGKICQQYQRVRSMTVHSSRRNKKMRSLGIGTPIFYSTEKIMDHSFCGAVDPTYFVVNIPGFIESTKFNSCLNQKIGIDTNGEIKNCPSMKSSYGNIKYMTIGQAIDNKNFRSVWTVTKDDVSVCKDCEFRYICPDCRVFTEGDSRLGKPAKCKYDPYTATWQ